MRCVNPHISGRAAFGCGQCMPCRFNRRRTWVHRLMLESMCHENSSFVTLTYSDDKLPSNRSLQPEHLSAWLKRLRRRVEPSKMRFFACGEYGDKSQRPHYHAALFNYGCCVGGTINKEGECQCAQCLGVRETWGFGHVMVGSLTEKSATYIAGYVVKKMTSSTDARLAGRSPEFARMSLRPGIGANALWDVASALMQHSLGDQLPSQLRHGARLLPLGRYLRGQLSKYLGHSDAQKASLSDQALSHLYAEMQLVRSVAWATDKAVRSVYREVNEPYSDALEGRARLRERRSL